MQVCGNLGVLEREHNLYQSRDPGSRLEVPDVRLDGADNKRAIRPASFAEHAAQGVHFNGIAQRRTGAVHFNVGHVARRDSGVRERTPNNLLLRRPVRCSQSAAASILVHGAAGDHRQHSVAIAESVAESLQDYDSTPFATHVSVR